MPVNIQPRVIRLRDAPGYLGMDKNRFNEEVRPMIPEFPMGKQGVCFDRFDLDVWWDQYKSCNRRPISKSGEKLWDEKYQDFANVKTGFGISKSKFSDKKFARVLEQAASKKLGSYLEVWVRKKDFCESMD